MLERVVSTQSNAEKQAAILLNRQRGVGPHRISAIKASFGSLYAFWQSVKANPESLPPLLKTHWHNPDVTGLKTDLAWEAQHPDHHIITLDDSRYPLLLKQSPGAPAVLFVKLPWWAHAVPPLRGRVMLFTLVKRLSKRVFV